MYHPPGELFKAFPEFLGHVWKAFIQLYGEFKAGLYWYKIFIPLLLQTFKRLQQSIDNQSLLFCPERKMAILVCTDETLVAIPESKMKIEAKMAQRFELHERQMLPTDFKGLFVKQDNEMITLSQEDYLKMKGKLDEFPTPPTKNEIKREMDEK